MLDMEELGYFLFMDKQEKKNDRDEKRQQEQLQKLNVDTEKHFKTGQTTTEKNCIIKSLLHILKNLLIIRSF